MRAAAADGKRASALAFLLAIIDYLCHTQHFHRSIRRLLTCPANQVIEFAITHYMWQEAQWMFVLKTTKALLGNHRTITVLRTAHLNPHLAECWMAEHKRRLGLTDEKMLVSGTVRGAESVNSPPFPTPSASTHSLAHSLTPLPSRSPLLRCQGVLRIGGSAGTDSADSGEGATNNGSASGVAASGGGENSNQVGVGIFTHLSTLRISVELIAKLNYESPNSLLHSSNSVISATKFEI